MIVDAHSYCFPPLDSPAGFATVAEHMRYVQSSIGGHHQPVWRMRDRARADNSTIIDPANPTPMGIKDVNFRRDAADRLIWTYQGEDYTKQYLPPMLCNLEFPPEKMVAEMDYAGVDLAVLHTDTFLGEINAYLGDCVRRFPDRLKGLVHLFEWDIPGNPDAAIADLARSIQEYGLSALQFIPPYYYMHGGNEAWDDGPFRPFWEAVSAMNIPVFLTLGAKGTPFLDSYLEEHRILMRWMERYPHIQTVMTHGLPWRQFIENNRIRFPESIWEPFSSPQLSLEILLPIRIGDLWDYPYAEVRPVVAECVERIGANRLMWGTDLPMVSRFCTYRQSLDYLRRYCDFMSAEEMALILGGTVERVLYNRPL
ncbi:MAG: amidohydrolase [Chloroflexi bacterium]|nr:amidohydrolase [Chloroflexota bacterium]